MLNFDRSTYSAPPGPLAGLRALFLRGREGKELQKGKEERKGIARD